MQSVSDLREAARRRLPPFLFEYIDGGAFDEQTMRRNQEDLGAICLRQKVLRDVSQISTETELFGQKLTSPVLLAPVGLAGMNSRRGEVAAARAAHRYGVPFCLSTVSVCPIEEVAAAVAAPIWFQLYMIRDRAFMRDLLQNALDAGCKTLVFTVDMPVPGTRYRDYRSGLAGASGITGFARRCLQAAFRPHWAWNVGIMGRPHTLGNIAPSLRKRPPLEDFFAWMSANFDPTVTWKDLEEIRALWPGSLVIKGILDSEDAIAAASMGADGLVVSNHGGRQLDGAVSTIRVLPAIADAVGDRVAVLADGGVRSGLDVARMLSLGARGVMLGRAWAYALGAKGEKGVFGMLDQIEKELRVTMALTGTQRVEDFGPGVLDVGSGFASIKASRNASEHTGAHAQSSGARK
nr:FMN-dependent L-lactate dehydrogenase LldD [Erythrobacter sp. AP23]